MKCNKNLLCTKNEAFVSMPGSMRVSEGGGATTTTIGNDSTVPMIPTEQISCTSCLSKLTRFMIILG